jgi:hypothetical protein
LAAIASPAEAFDGQADIGTAYGEASLRVDGVVNIIEEDIGGHTYTPGLYKSTSPIKVARDHLVLHGKGVYIFQMEGTLKVGYINPCRSYKVLILTG